MLRDLVRSIARWRGYEILGPLRAYATQKSLIGLVRQERINLVLDVGANTGQFAKELFASGYPGKILSFEPLVSAHAELCKKARGVARWTVAERMAIGATNGFVEMHVSENSVSSSILAMLPLHAEAEPKSVYVRTESVPVNRLDDVCVLSEADRVLLKIDVQGYERQVLEGATRVLGACRAVLAEMSLTPLYDGQVMARELWGWLEGSGLEPWSFEPGFRHPESGRMLQIDGVFVRRADGSRG